MAANTWTTMLRLACKDYWHEFLLSACAVLGLAAVLTPLLVLYGVKFGVVQTLTERLRNDPRNLEISPVISGRYTRRTTSPDWPPIRMWPLCCRARAPLPPPWI
ncbi:MAG: hypothetical protein QM665_00805 [Desulfovibrio sp.]